MTQTQYARNAILDILRRINRDIALRASRFADALLTGAFRSIFRVEKAYEITDPEVFQLEYEPSRILWSRLNEYQLSNLPIAIANEEVLASRYQMFTEYDFLIIADVSQSMMLEWRQIYGDRSSETGGVTAGTYVEREIFRRLEQWKWKIPGDRTKLFLLKYLLASFLHAARSNDFFSYVILFGGTSEPRMYDSHQDPNLEETVLNHIDKHCSHTVRHGAREEPMIGKALRNVLARKRRAIVLCISDFMDCLQHIDEGQPRLQIAEVVLPIAEIAARHPTVVLQVNHVSEIEPQISTTTHKAKNVAFLNSEKYESDEEVPVKEKDHEDYLSRVDAWHTGLRHSFANFGIKFCQMVAGRPEDDEQVDRKIHELGVATRR